MEETEISSVTNIEKNEKLKFEFQSYISNCQEVRLKNK